MPPGGEHHPTPPRRINPAARMCFTISGIAFVACALGLLVNHLLTGALAIAGTAAVALVYLAMGLMSLNGGPDAEFRAVAAPRRPQQGLGATREPGTPENGTDGVMAAPGRHDSSKRETAVVEGE